MSYSQEDLRESPESTRRVRFLEDSRCVTSLVLHFTSSDSPNGALRTVAIEMLIREFD